MEHSSSWSGPQLFWKCIDFAQEAISGLSLLQLAGVNSGQPPEIYDWGGGAYTVCQIDRQPRTIPDRCFGPMSGPNWSDWTQTSAGWVARSTGTAAYTVQDGGMEGWTYSAGTGTPPPAVSFNQVCPAPVVATATLPARVASAPSLPSTSTASPPAALQAVAPSLSPTAGTALASTGPPTQRSKPAALAPWLLLGGAVILLSGLGAINLRRRGP